jgi:hypothetical protein
VPELNMSYSAALIMDSRADNIEAFEKGVTLQGEQG